MFLYKTTKTKTIMSNFEKSVHFNKVFGVTVHNTLQPQLFDNNPQLVQYRVNLILEEVKELQDAVKNKDMTETIDALADILFVVYGMGATMGINLDKAYDIVYESNMTKLCKTEQEAIDTIEWYKANESRYAEPTYRKSDDQQFWIVYDKATGKILKNINYIPANFEQIN